MIRWESVTVAYNGSLRLGPFDLHAADGEWVGLIGPNGAGKSTMLKAAVGLVEHAGTVRVRDGNRRPGLDFAWMPQRPAMPEHMTVAEYVMLGRSPHIGYLSSESERDRAVVSDALERLDLTRFAHRTLATLSGGEAQRAVLARAVAQEAPVLLLDEPTASLDLGHAVEVLEVVEDLRRESGLTVVTAIHDLTLAARFCDRLVLLSGGTVAAQGGSGEVLTEEVLRPHYGASVTVVHGPDGPAVLPRRIGT
ncbi:MAG: ABC transporter ATP-binding protein [Actinomycetes bacterium]|nr:MAG: ABC transporter [Actinomycetota bacterium]